MNVSLIGEIRLELNIFVLKWSCLNGGQDAKTRLRWFGYVKGKMQIILVRKYERLTI